MSLYFCLFYLVTFGTSLSCCLQFASASNNETDKLALLDIKAKITDDPLGILNSWNDSQHFCEWQQVHCSRHGRVRKLYLGSSKLSGTLSPYIGNLSFIKWLLVENNSFTGMIPPEIGRLHRLEYLWLFNNHFGGEIPPNISMCSNLVQLSVHDNKLVGGIPPELGSLSNLQVLFLHANNLTTIMPSSLGNLSSLNELNLGQNNLVGRIPDSLGRLKNITFISLFHNELSGEVPQSIFNLSMLSTLDLSSNHFKGSLPRDLGITLPSIQVFFVNDNLFTGSIPISFSNLSNLQVLQLSDNGLQGQVPSLNKLVSLQYLRLFGNLLGSGQASDLNFISSLSNATMLQEIDIHDNKFGGVYPDVVCNFSLLTTLELGTNQIAGGIPICIGNLVNLQSLSAEGCKLNGVIPSSIGKLKNLEIIDLSENQLTGHIPSSIENLTKLSLLDFSDNYLEGYIPSALGSCINLYGVDLSGNNLSGQIPPQIFGLSTLSYVLNLSSNHLTGTLPTEVGKLTNLVNLDVSQNLLSDEIPSTLATCVELQILNLQGNLFHGAIPNSLKTLNSLVALDLSRNNLTGEIPEYLEHMHLQMLNLSYNNLIGEVPTVGVFRNGSGVAVYGNRELCGGILQLKLPSCKFSKTHNRRRVRRKRLVVALVVGLSGVLLFVVVTLLYVLLYAKKPTVTTDSEKGLLNVSYHSILKATDGFSAENLIGSGAFGVVYKGTLDPDRRIVAIKKINLEHKGASKSFLAECGVLRNIRHRNLVKVLTVCSSIDNQGNDFKALVYEYMVNGSLDNWLHHDAQNIAQGTNNAPRYLNLAQRLAITVEVARALEYLHHGCEAPIVHCDLKPSNILLDDDMVARVGDFGLAKFISQGIITQSSSIGVRGTVGYTPPEYGLGNEVSTQGDVYSFGILLMEIFTGKRPTDGMFTEGQSLRSLVQAALPECLPEILDPTLLADLVNDGSRKPGADISIVARIKAKVLEALISVLETALACSDEIAQQRSNMSEVAAKLSGVRNNLQATTIYRVNP